MLNYNDNTKRCIVCRTKHTWFDLILDSFNSMEPSLQVSVFSLTQSVEACLPPYPWCHAPYFPRDSTACGLQIHSPLINPHRQTFQLAFFQMTVSAERRLYAQLCYGAFIEQCRRQWPQHFSQRDKKGTLDQKKRQALRNRIPFVHDQIFYIFCALKQKWHKVYLLESSKLAINL